MEPLEPDRTNVVFNSLSGPLTVRRDGKSYVMDFPSRPSERIAAPPELSKALNAAPIEVLANQFNYMALLESEQLLRELAPDMSMLARIGRPGVIVTTAGSDGHDFVSRYFAPAKGIPEDPVTGSAHCMLVPYWARRLGKTSFEAFQASRRGGGRLPAPWRAGRVGGCVRFLPGRHGGNLGSLSCCSVIRPRRCRRRRG